MSIVDTLRVIISLVLTGFALFQLYLMLMAETASNYNSWAIAAGTLLVAIGFAFIAVDGQEKLQTKAGEDK